MAEGIDRRGSQIVVSRLPRSNGDGVQGCTQKEVPYKRFAAQRNGLRAARSVVQQLYLSGSIAHCRGLKVTLIWQVALTASLEPQVLVWPKSLAFVPAMPMELNASTAFPHWSKSRLRPDWLCPPTVRKVKRGRRTICDLGSLSAVGLRSRLHLPCPEPYQVEIAVSVEIARRLGRCAQWDGACLECSFAVP